MLFFLEDYINALEKFVLKELEPCIFGLCPTRLDSSTKSIVEGLTRDVLKMTEDYLNTPASFKIREFVDLMAYFGGNRILIYSNFVRLTADRGESYRGIHMDLPFLSILQSFEVKRSVHGLVNERVMEDLKLMVRQIPVQNPGFNDFKLILKIVHHEIMNRIEY